MPFRRAARSAESTVPLWATKEILSAPYGAPKEATLRQPPRNTECLIVKNMFNITCYVTQKTFGSLGAPRSATSGALRTNEVKIEDLNLLNFKAN